MGMSSNAVNTPVGVMGTSWQLAISSWNMLTCSLALLYRCLRETRAVACVWRGFGRPLPTLIRHLALWPMWATLAIMVMVTIKGIIVRVEQMMLSERLRWKLSQKGSDYCLMEAVVASIRLRNAYRGGTYLGVYIWFPYEIFSNRKLTVNEMIYFIPSASIFCVKIHLKLYFNCLSPTFSIRLHFLIVHWMALHKVL